MKTHKAPDAGDIEKTGKRAEPRRKAKTASDPEVRVNGSAAGEAKRDPEQEKAEFSEKIREQAEAAEKAAKDKGPPPDSATTEAEFKRLAPLPELEYLRQRKRAAEFLQLNVSDLDRLVRSARETMKPGLGDATPPDVEPSSGSPVDGIELVEKVCAALRRHIVFKQDRAEQAVAL